MPTGSCVHTVWHSNHSIFNRRDGSYRHLATLFCAKIWFFDSNSVNHTLHRNTYLSTLQFWGVFCLTANIRTPQRTVSAMQRFAVSQKNRTEAITISPFSLSLLFSAKNRWFATLRCTKTGSTQPTLSAARFVVQSCLADADFVVFSNYCLIGTRHMFVRFLWMLQTVKYPQRSKLPTFHTLSKVLKLHMSFNTVPILWLEGRAGMVRASWYKDDGEYLRTFGYQKKARHCSKYAATFACWIKSVRTGPIFTAKKQKNKTAKFFQT